MTNVQLANISRRSVEEATHPARKKAQHRTQTPQASVRPPPRTRTPLPSLNPTVMEEKTMRSISKSHHPRDRNSRRSRPWTDAPRFSRSRRSTRWSRTATEVTSCRKMSLILRTMSKFLRYFYNSIRTKLIFPLKVSTTKIIEYLKLETRHVFSSGKIAMNSSEFTR